MAVVTVCTDPRTWDDAVTALGGHPLQRWGWGELKARHRWWAQRLLVHDGDALIGGAQVLGRRIPVPGKSILYAPRGPMWAPGRGDDVVAGLLGFLKRQGRGVVLTVEPDDVELPLRERFVRTPAPILLASTLIVDTGQSEDAMLANMASKTRYYVRKVGKDPSLSIQRVTTDAELDRVLDVYDATAARAGFALHSREYYRDIQRCLGDDSVLWASYADGAPVAFVWDAYSARTAFELYGGMNEVGQKKRANVALKWHAIRAAKAHGITRYDMNGLLNDGISAFKKGFADDHTDELVGSLDYPLSPLYRAYAVGLPLAKRALRGLHGLRGRAATGVRRLTRRGAGEKADPAGPGSGDAPGAPTPQGEE